MSSNSAKQPDTMLQNDAELLLLPTVAAAVACLLLRSSNSTDAFLLSSSANLLLLPRHLGAQTVVGDVELLSQAAREAPALLLQCTASNPRGW
ncbi:MAG: hypothetical protein GY772_16145, partial [bacterium]|nr:hypothetical protein [bacterium]